MDIFIGSLVRACAGRDKDSVFVASEIHDGFVFIADGKDRKLSRPKRKNPKHISPTGAVIDMNGLTDKQLRRLIREYKSSVQHDTKPLNEEVF